ncbi:MAG: hypothetical protein MJ137_00820 [Clostridia bacterium]|nr:hypothetical protein [Clostridia bacterium]
MKSLTNISALLLCALMLISSLAACADKGDSGATTVPSATTAPESQGETVYDPLASVPVQNFDGYEFNILTPTHDWAICNLAGSEITGDTIQDAIYSRQLNTEKRLNVKINERILPSGVAALLMSQSVASGDEAYDVAQVPTHDALALYVGGYTTDLGNVSTINLDNPWWEKSFNEQVNYGNKRHYIAFGNQSLIYYSSFYIFVFNKEMIKSYNLDNPYDLVKNNQWTWEKAYQMMTTVATDSDGDGAFNPGKDILGITGHVNHSRNILFSSGFTICESDNEGNLSFDNLTDNYITAFRQFTDYFIASPYAALAGVTPGRYNGYTGAAGIKNYISVFIEGKSLFLTTGTNEVLQIRETETEYGIVVVPKYTESQEKYITPVYSATAGMVIPTCCGNTERAGLVLETMGGYSYQNIVDKHIGIVLHYRVSQDPTAIEMINLAYANGAIDTAMANNFGTCVSVLNNLNVLGSGEVARVFTGIKSKLKSDITAAENALD